ncbi:MAG: family 43 glycosylhydrolase [Anaerolineales bacterium]|nr:family 43 glycosylhydrolase [Anaerolineales bacterium]
MQSQWPMLYIGLVTAALYALLAGWVHDDPFITYRYSYNLAHGLGFVYNPGERVLSTTTPLFTLLLAVLYRLWGDLPHMANLVGAFSLALGSFFIWQLAEAWETRPVGWAGLLLYPTFPLLCNAVGSEIPLYLVFCLGAFAAYAREKFYLSAGLAALATLTRPDGLLVFAILATDYWLNKRDSLPGWPKSSVRPGLIFLGLVIPWFIFSWLYFGAPLPATLAAKQQQGLMAVSQRFAPGVFTIIRLYLSAWQYWLEALLALMGIAAILRRPNRWMLLLAWTAVYFISYTLLGVSRYPWYYAALVPGFIAAVGMGTALAGKNRKPFAFKWVGIGLLAVLALAQCYHTWQFSQYTDPRYQIYRAVGEWLDEKTPADAAVGTLEAGIIGYYAQRRLIDFAGLLQPEIAEQLSRNSTYQDSASWVLENYHPEYVVLQEGMFPELEQGYISQHCQLSQRFPGESFEYHHAMNIYRCSPAASGNEVQTPPAHVLASASQSATTTQAPLCTSPGWYPTDFGLKDHAIFWHAGYYYLVSILIPPEDPALLKQNRFAYARSIDLCQWEDLSPILADRPPGAWDEAAIWAPTVYQEAGTYYMFYTGVTRDYTQSILLATSTNPADPASWEKEDFIFQPNHPEMIWQVGEWADCRDPYVTKIDEQYHLYYTGRDRSGRNEAGRGIIGLATAPSLFGPWTDHGSILPLSDGQSAPAEMLESPFLVQMSAQDRPIYYLFYTRSYQGGEYRVSNSPAGSWQGPVDFQPGWAHEFWQDIQGKWFTSYLTSYSITISPLTWDAFFNPWQPWIGENVHHLIFPLILGGAAPIRE